jgi:hypothetical protein
LGILQDKKKHEEFEEAFCTRCQEKHIARDCPLDSLRICGICDLNHSTDSFPSLPRMKETYQGDLGAATSSLQQPWKLWPTCMVQNSIPPFSYSHNQSWNTPIPWKPWEPQYHPYLPCPQGWNGPSYDPMTTFPHVAAPTNPLYFPPTLQQYPTCTSRSTTQINQLHLLHLPSHLTPPCPTQILFNPPPTLTIIKQYNMLTVLNCKIFLHFPPVLPHLHHCKKMCICCRKPI